MGDQDVIGCRQAVVGTHGRVDVQHFAARLNHQAGVLDGGEPERAG